MNDSVLETVGLKKSFGAIVVANGISLHLAAGARHALIGPNGAGKTTLVGLLSGTIKADAGNVRLMGHEVTRESAQRRVKRGLVRSFQVNSLFRSLTVLENVFLAVSEHRGASSDMFGAAWRRLDLLESAQRVIDDLGLGGDMHRRVFEIPYGKQRLVELAIAMTLEPKVLLLDEPAAGIPSAEVGRVLDAIERLPPEVAILLIEHDMQVVRRFADQVTVMVAGTILVTGSPSQVMSSDEVRSVYLGQAGFARFGHASVGA
jgi:branched-chain amino acid transport system ATP-binding protein